MEKITVSIIKDGDWFVSHCLDYDIASQGTTREEARENIIEAVKGFLEVASADEIRQRLASRGHVEELSLGSV